MCCWFLLVQERRESLVRQYVTPVVGYDTSLMDIFSRDILAKIQTGTSGWEKMVPARAAAIIKERNLFGYNDSASPSMAG